MYVWEWLQGGYSNLADDPPVNANSSATRIRTAVSLAAKEKVRFACPAGFQYCYSVYKDGVRQEYNASWKKGADEKIWAFGAGNYVVYLSLARADNTEILPGEADSAVTLLADNAVRDLYGALSEAAAVNRQRNLFDRSAANTTRGYYDRTNTWMNVAGLGQTDYIPVKQGCRYVSSNTSTLVLWYTAEKEFLSATTGQEYSRLGYVVPVENAAYAKFIIPAANIPDFFVYSNEAEDREILKAAVPYGAGNPYAGKKAVAFGTSLTYRAKSSGGYLEYLPYMAEMTVDNQGLGNSTIVPHPDHTDMMGKITDYTDWADKDVVLLEGFVNDWYDNADKLGTWKDTAADTVCGAVRQAIGHISAQAPQARIILILDHYGQAWNGNPGCASTVVKSGLTQTEYYDEIAKLAAGMAVPVIRGYAESGMSEAYPAYYIDIIHPSPQGAYAFAAFIWSKMKDIPLKVS